MVYSGDIGWETGVEVGVREGIGGKQKEGLEETEEAEEQEEEFNRVLLERVQLLMTDSRKMPGVGKRRNCRKKTRRRRKGRTCPRSTSERLA